MNDLSVFFNITIDVHVFGVFSVLYADKEWTYFKIIERKTPDGACGLLLPT